MKRDMDVVKGKWVQWQIALVLLGVAVVGVGLYWYGGQTGQLREGQAVVDKVRAWLPIAGLRVDDSNVEEQKAQAVQESFLTLWFSDFARDRIGAFNRTGDLVWEQHMGSPPIPQRSYATNTEYVTVAPNGNLIVADGDGMMVQEIDRQTHELVWQYGVKDLQDYAGGQLHQPDKSFKLNDHEVLINDGNNRRVIIVDQRTDEIVWQYGVTRRQGSAPGQLNGNTSVRPVEENTKFLITDTLDKKVLLVARESGEIVNVWRFPEAKWIQHAWYTEDGGLVMEDRQKNEVWEVDRYGQVQWRLVQLADGSSLRYPTDVIKLGNGHVLIAEGGRGRIIEVDPAIGKVVREYRGAGFVSTIAIDHDPI